MYTPMYVYMYSRYVWVSVGGWDEYFDVVPFSMTLNRKDKALLDNVAKESQKYYPSSTNF